MRIHATVLLGITGIMLGFHREADAVLPASSQPGTIGEKSSTEETRVPSPRPCPKNLQPEWAKPLGPGPARLATIRCLDLPRGQDNRLPPVVSPDGGAVAFWGTGQVSPIDIVSFDGSFGFRLSNRVAFRGFGSDDQNGRQDALTWQSDGEGLWSVEQQVMHPAGRALSGLIPIQIERDGHVRRLAPPAHPAGPLDAVAWVGGVGRAIVQFGTRGHFDRSEDVEPSPTLAMVDIPRRQILHTLTGADAEAMKVRAGHDGFGLFAVSAVQLRDGRLRALLQFNRVMDSLHRQASPSDPSEDRFLPAKWLLWTEGETPVPLKPLFDDHLARAELTPNGSHILVWRALQPKGVVIQDCRQCPPSSPPTPINAVIAALIDTKSARTVWRLQARASEFGNSFGGPVISPSGRFALIRLPAADQRQMIALLSMANGRIVQRFSLACHGCYPESFGFTRNGGQMWIRVLNRLAFYDLE